MITYPKDNFYVGYSLGVDINRSGKDHYDYVKQQLGKSKIKTTAKIVDISLETIQLIHKNVKKHAKTEQNQRIVSLRKKKIVGDVIPIDVTLADEVFRMLMDRIDPYVVAGLLLLGLKGKILFILNKLKTKDLFDRQTKNAAKKVLLNDKNDLILKNIIEIHIHNDQVKKKKRTKSKKKSKTKK